MTAVPDFDWAAAHRYFAAHCFNAAWDLLDKSDRTEEDNRQMVALNMASLYHWSRRRDCTDTNRSVGYWQASRIHAVLGHADEARRYGETCLEFSKALPPFYRGYAHEALARAASVAGDGARVAEHAARGRDYAAQVTDEADRKRLLDDLAAFR
jgi:cation transport regulator ChaB